LPALDWKEGLAFNVARTMLRRFGRYAIRPFCPTDDDGLQDVKARQLDL
jgi:hypothetical protein